MGLLLILLQAPPAPPTAPPAPPAVAPEGIQILIALFLMVVVILLLILVITRGAASTSLPQGQSWLDYGNFFIVTFGLAVANIGLLGILIFLNVIGDRTQALAFLTAFFGLITGLVGTYFGIKQSADARAQAHDLASSAIATQGQDGQNPEDKPPVGDPHPEDKPPVGGPHPEDKPPADHPQSRQPGDAS